MCREPNIEDTDEYVDTWEESLADTITAAPSGSTGCKVAPLSEPSDLVLPRSVQMCIRSWHTVAPTRLRTRLKCFILGLMSTQPYPLIGISNSPVRAPGL